VCPNLKAIALLHSFLHTDRLRAFPFARLTCFAIRPGTSCRLALWVPHPLH